jgi:hypothetical protein
MHALWSRTAQASSCRCSACLQGATSIARRTTTAASRRGFKAGDLFTACYSTILATAAVVDAKVKDDRRREWDRLIAEAKSLPIEKQDAPNYMATGDISKICDGERSAERRNPVLAVWDGIRWSTATASKDAQSTIQPKVLDPHDSITKLARMPANHSPANIFVGEEEWIDEDFERVLPPRKPRNYVQIRKVEEAVLKLIDRLLLQSMANSSIQSSSLSAGAIADLTAQMKEMTMRIDALRHGHTRVPSYSYLDAKSVRQEQAELHDALRVLLKKAESNQSSIDIILAKICYNLLISTSPPNITTYNVLIEHFTRLERHDLAQIVVDSFLDETRYRPNTMTVCVLLDHFVAKRDSRGFRKIIKRMRAVDGDMRIKRRALSALSIPSVQDWARSNKVIHRNGFLSQKVSRNAHIFDSLIQGCLKLADVRSAIRYLRAALREGCQVKSGTLCEIAVECVEQLDYKAGRSLLHTILLQWEDNISLNHGIEYCRASRHAVYQILNFCGVSADLTEQLPVKGSRDALERVKASRNALRRVKASLNALQRLVRHMTIMSVADSVDRFSERVSLVQSVLNTKSPGLTQEFKIHGRLFRFLESETYPDNVYQRLDLAMQILDRASIDNNRRVNRVRQNGWRARMNAIKALRSSLRVQLKDFKSMQEMLLPISYNHLSPQSKSEYNASTRRTISKKMDLLLSLHRKPSGKIPIKSKSSSRKKRPQRTSQQASPSTIQVEVMPKRLTDHARPFYDVFPILRPPTSDAQFQL